MHKKTIAILAGTVVVLAIVAAIVIPQIVQHQREQRFLELLRESTMTDIGQTLPEEQLLISLKVECKDISNGITLEDKRANSYVTWEASSGLSDTSYEQYMANTLALYEAAKEVC